MSSQTPPDANPVPIESPFVPSVHSPVITIVSTDPDSERRQLKQPSVYDSLSLVVFSMIRCFNSEHVNRAFKNYSLDAVVPVGLSIFLILLCVSPLMIICAAYAPGLLWCSLVLVPLWTLISADHMSPLYSARMFISGLRDLSVTMTDDFSSVVESSYRSTDSNLNEGAEVEEEGNSFVGQHVDQRGLLESVWYGVRNDTQFLTWSLASMLFCLVPGIGSMITAVIITCLTVRRMSQFMIDQSHVCDVFPGSIPSRDVLIENNKKVIYSYCFLWVLFLALPVIGPFLVGFAQASFADCYYNALARETSHASLVLESSIQLEVNGEELEINYGGDDWKEEKKNSHADDNEASMFRSPVSEV